MSLVASRATDKGIWRASEWEQVVGSKGLASIRTTPIERFLLGATIAALPIEDHVPTVGGFSMLFIMFGVMACYVLLNRIRLLNRTWAHPTFLAGYSLFLFCAVIETGHPFASYSRLMQFGFMLAGGIFFATLCRDKTALRAIAYGYLIGSLWLSAYLLFATYGVLSSASATNYNEASAARSAATDDLGLEGDLNHLAFLAVQGAVVGLALTLTARSVVRRIFFLVVTVFCLLGASMPMSRGGFLIIFVSCAVTLLTCQGKKTRGIVIGVALGAVMFLLIPSVVFQRMTISSSTDGRKVAYGAAIDNISKYFTIGVGDGNFWTSWAVKNGFISNAKKALGSHNIFFQITINWGFGALLLLFILIWQAFRCIPKNCGSDELALWIPGVVVAALVTTLFSHIFYDKSYSLALGLLVGVQRWIWPKAVFK